MSKATTGKTTTEGAPVLQVVRLLVDAADTDTLYRDVYLNRAETLLGAVLSRQQYEGLEGMRRKLEHAVQESKSAAMAQDWARVGALASEVEGLRHAAEQNAAAAEVAEAVYEAFGVAIDPFSPGVERFLKTPGLGSAEARDALLGTLAALARADTTLGELCAARRAFFSGLTVFSGQAAPAGDVSAAKSVADVERLAFEAAQRGDVAQLGRYAQQILALKEAEQEASAASAKTGAAAGPARATYECPVDLSVPYSDDVVRRARELGFAAARTEPLPVAAAILDHVAERAWRTDLSDRDVEREGTMRGEALVDEAGLPAEVSEPVKVLVSQFLRSPFINSGGARYLPRFAAESALLEDFPEDQEAPAQSPLLSALGLARRRGLSRVEIECALLLQGATILRERLGLDPKEFRLVCIPHDLYMRFGRDHGWGQQQQWTHFDGYHVLKGGVLRALVGGDVRHGGLSDLLSIAINDEREKVVARFAVIRRARQVARWH